MKLGINGQKGMTMVALVVSIMVMLIIAGVSIRLVINTDIIGKAAELDVRTEFSELADEWNTRRAELNMRNIPDDEINYSDIKNATIIIGQTDLQERVIRTVEISDTLNAKIEIKKGKIVYRADKCTPEEIDFFVSQEIKEVNEV